MNIYISFGQSHTHRVDGVTFDCDVLARIKCETHKEGRERAFELFGAKFFTDYPEEKTYDEEFMSFFPRGILDVT